ncbi:MAG: 2-iminobutanoate/2-iminopropanoate deaminase [Cryomorphaceae bacterium]|jgi:2-iminobutanoate/2-iminopropanoate deaminase
MEIIKTKNAPAPIGPYNQAVVHENTIYISGQVALEPDTGKMDNANLAEETHRVMRNLGAVLQAAGSDFDHLIKCSIFILDMNEFKTINEVYASFFNDHHPARETVEVSKLPAGARVEISAIAKKI